MLWAYNWDTSNSEQRAGVAYTVGKWTHVVWVHHNGIMSIYKDGNFASSTPSASTREGFHPFRIGQAYLSSPHFSGSIDDVRVYDHALSASEVAQLYHSGAANVAHSNAMISNGLVGYWTFDGSATNWTTNTTADLSGNGNNGTIVSMSTTTSPVLGKIGQALNFDGSSQKITTAAGVSSICSVSTCSLSVWLYPTGSALAVGSATTAKVRLQMMRAIWESTGRTFQVPTEFGCTTGMVMKTASGYRIHRIRGHMSLWCMWGACSLRTATASLSVQLLRPMRSVPDSSV